jgi:hypothetical protein
LPCGGIGRILGPVSEPTKAYCNMFTKVSY